MRLYRSINWMIVLLFSPVIFKPVFSQVRTQEIERGDEKELKVKLDYAAGKLFLRKIDDDKLCRISLRDSDREVSPTVDYVREGGIGHLNLDLNENQTLEVFDIGKQNLQLQLTDKIPISFKMDMGACSGTLDFTNLRVKDLTLSLGASSTNIMFNAQNKDRMNKFKIDAGVSKLSVTGLSNANFDKLEFEGGVGTYTLDFSGNLSQNSTARLSLGIGKLLIRLPKNVSAKIHTDDSFISSIRISESDFVRRAGGVYTSANYDDSGPRLEMWIETGLGNLKIEAIE
jgi:hypothetical protein